MKIITLLMVMLASGFAFSVSDETRTGCVMQTEAGWFTFCEPDACAEIKGTGVDAKLAGRKVTARGTMQTESATGKTFVVTQVVTVGGACDERCSPRPVGHRGLGSKDKPGAEGGTPGVTPTAKVPPPR